MTGLDAHFISIHTFFALNKSFFLLSSYLALFCFSELLIKLTKKKTNSLMKNMMELSYFTVVIAIATFF